MRPSTLALTSYALACFACGGESFSDTGDAAAGGSQTSGGNSATGGVSPGGGNSAMGGAAATGGTQGTGGNSIGGGTNAATGGVNATGGAKSTGGHPSTGGAIASGGAKPLGGSPATGGLAFTGGANSVGGNANTGGFNQSGGAKLTGGNPGVGGTTATGGTTPRGGAAATGGSANTIPCGSNVCQTGQHCCDASCGICSLGNVCPAIACALGGNTSTGGTVSTGGSVGTGGNVATGGSASVTPCDTNCTSAGFTCCDKACRNTSNDPYNCGQCGNICPNNAPVCQSGQCTSLTCTAELGPPGTVCCGTLWCGVGQLCCDVQGPLSGIACLTPTDGTCPRGCKQCVCANPDTPIATPTGARSISELRVGDLVYSVDKNQIVPVPIAAVKMRPARSHIAPQILLDNGQVLQISARHPTADRRTFGDLREGDKLGELRVKAVELVTYEHAFTYDILPASDTGFYFAGGALIGSTLGPHPEALSCEKPTIDLE